MEEPLRIRLVFEDGELLSKSQRSAGLKRSWLLLNPTIATISDLESHVRTSFHLRRSCRHGLLLSMDDFILPPFESTCVLRDKDIIRIRKRDAAGMDMIEHGDDPCYIQYSEVLEMSDKLLAIKEFGEDSDQHKRKNNKDLRAYNENAVHVGTSSKSKNKRKHLDGIQGSKKKKLKTSPKKPSITYQEDENNSKKDEESHLGKSVGSSQKRGSSHKCSTMKKLKTRPKKPSITCQEDENNSEKDEEIHLGKSIGSSQKRGSSHKCSTYEDTPSTLNRSQGVVSQMERTVEQLTTSVQREKRNAHVEGKKDGNTCERHVNGSTTKVQSRSARRKKLRRQWLRELKSQQGQSIQSQVPSDVIHNNKSAEKEQAEQQQAEQQQAEKNTEMEEEIVHVVIRPGHIRFQPLDEDQSQWESQQTMETLQWNGTTSKKKGQKWGMEKNLSYWNDSNGYIEHYNGTEKTSSKLIDANGCNENENGNEKTRTRWSDNGYKEQCSVEASRKDNANGYKEQSSVEASRKDNANGYKEQCRMEATKWDKATGYKEQSNIIAISEKGRTRSSAVDFEGLFPLTRIPQVGDVLAYRMVELSSSWCPEVSCFRVGEVTSYDCVNMNIVLAPVPEYPILNDEDIESSDPMLQVNSSPYNEDGSLQIHYLSLVDVRLLKASDSSAACFDEMITPEAALVNCELAVINSESDATEMVTQPIEYESAGSSAWDQIKQALNEKKAQLLKKNDDLDKGTPSKSTAGTPWSYRVLRRSAVGPTLAYLRGKNDNDPSEKLL